MFPVEYLQGALVTIIQMENLLLLQNRYAPTCIILYQLPQDQASIIDSVTIKWSSVFVDSDRCVGPGGYITPLD